MSLQQMANKHGLSQEAVEHLADALQRGNGTQAQFNHPELGGMGQWQNGMVMIGDAFNTQLKAKVNAVCSELSGLMRDWQSESFKMMAMNMPQTTRWWSDELGEAASIGQQNDTYYAIFPDKSRLVMREGQVVTTYDTQSYHLTGVSQQQSNTRKTLVFTTRDGKTVTVDDFRKL